MSASYPTSKKTFTQIVDGVTYMEAVNINVAYDEIEAIETFLGSLGRSQSYSASLKNLLINYRHKVGVEYKAAGEIYVKAGEVAIKDSSDNVAFRRNTSDLTLDWNDLDTGSEANDTQYYVYAVADATGTGFLAVISANATQPSGYTYYRKIGEFYNDGDGDIVKDSVNAVGIITLYLGDWEEKDPDTIYLANTNGFVCAEYTAGSSNGNVIGYTDDSTPPTTERNTGSHSSETTAFRRSGMCMPVKKGDYWKVTDTNVTYKVYWIPLIRGEV